MKNKTQFVLWGALYILCAGLGFIPEPSGFLRTLLVVAGIGFFVPPALLVWQGGKNGDKRLLQLIRNLSALSLGLTAVLFILNFASVMWSERLGDILYGILVMVSSPMICCQYWALSLFLWASLLMTTMGYLRNGK